MTSQALRAVASTRAQKELELGVAVHKYWYFGGTKRQQFFSFMDFEELNLGPIGLTLYKINLNP